MLLCVEVLGNSDVYLPVLPQGGGGGGGGGGVLGKEVR